MTALIIIASILLFFVLIFSISIRLEIAYDEDILVLLKILFLKFNLYPGKDPSQSMSKKELRKLRQKERKKKQKKKKSENKTEQTDKPKEEKEEKKKPKKSFKYYINLVKTISKMVIKVLSKFFGYLKVNIKTLDIVVATNDAAKTALAYTAVCQSVNAMLHVIEDHTKGDLNTDEISCRCDYTGEEFSFRCDIEFKIRIWQILASAIFGGIVFIKNKIGGMFNGKQN